MNRYDKLKGFSGKWRHRLYNRRIIRILDNDELIKLNFERYISTGKYIYINENDINMIYGMITRRDLNDSWIRIT